MSSEPLLSLLLKNLTTEKKQELIGLFCNDLEDAQNVEAVCLLASEATMSNQKTVLNFCKNVINESLESNYTQVIRLVFQFGIYDEILAFIMVPISGYLNKKFKNLHEEFLEILGDYEPSAALPFDGGPRDLIPYLNFASRLFQKSRTIDDKDHPIDRDLLLLFAINDIAVCRIVDEIMRWRLDCVHDCDELVWKSVFALIKCGGEFAIEGYKLWLRYLSSRSVAQNAQFQNMISEPEYWKFLQQGLESKITYQRKYSLALLQLSIRAINVEVDNEMLRWIPGSSEAAWKKYMTYYEILAIDTSLHQAEAAQNDIRKLLDPDSLVGQSWGLCLLSTGFAASTDSVRRFSLALFMEISPQSMGNLANSPGFIVDVFLPYALSAHHFNIRKIDGASRCLYGELLTNFIATMAQECPKIARIILEYLSDKRESFDPARVYCMMGVLRGLPENSLKFGSDDIVLMKLADISSEKPVFEILQKCIILRLFTKFEFMEMRWFEMLVDFARLHGFKYIWMSRGSLKKYSMSHLAKVDCFDEVSTVLNLALKGSVPQNLSVERQIALLSSGLDVDLDLKIPDSWITEPIRHLHKVDFKMYADAIPDLTGSWEVVVANLNSANCADSLDEAISILKAFVSMYTHSSYELDVHVLLQTSLRQKKPISHLYKYNDEIDAEYWKLIAATVQKRSTIIPVAALDGNLAKPAANLAVVRLCCYLLDNEDSDEASIAEFLAQCWQNVTSAKLLLIEQEVQLEIIAALLHPRIMKASIEVETIARLLRKFCLSVLDGCFGRRSLWPALTRALSYCQQRLPDQFELIGWLPEVLVKASLIRQANVPGFALETLVNSMWRQIDESQEFDVYAYAYGPEESSARVNLLSIFNSIRSSSFADRIYRYILDHDEELLYTKAIRTTDFNEELVRVQLCQIVVSLMDICTLLDPEVYLGYVLTQPSPWARVYFEWIAAYLLMEERHQNVVDTIFHRITSSELKPIQVTALLRTIYLRTVQLTGDSKSHQLNRLLTVLISSTSSSKATVRHFSLSLSCAIYASARNETIDHSLLKVLGALYETVSSSPQFGSYRPGDAQLWDIVEDFNLVNIAGGLVMRTSERDTHDWLMAESFTRYLTDGQKALLRRPVGHDLREAWIISKQNTSRAGVSTRATPTPDESRLQTKSGAWSTVMDIDANAARAAENIVRSDLIVVSSLVDKAPNLGGICRLCDVLGAGLMTLHDIQIKTHPQFKSVAVTADRWMPMLEVKADELLVYLRTKKREGYTLIGLEQTDNSVQLSAKVEFPKKSLFLLGKEKEGVPGHLLAELDWCVEIKQVGVIRSMNIQTATAVLVQAYSSQHC
ncbi:tRNA (guanosine(18)-2'-O)-methyltransferase [Diutina catenulata]